ncbi:hypothetical protein PHISCL_09401 [Aspergillus sclerotialis]|uniref:Uncharacterized protein n=1 Tax=Aspergillus sclerotialis TaxID=2070753 RepID=A0A3A2ZK74_9EURO|nr:hypothetical protein PHISCL_09401 [Aspergillus sclerotialis]
MSTRSIFLMGAPAPETLDWDKDELLDKPVAPFSAIDNYIQEYWPFSDDAGVKWRSLQDRGLEQSSEFTAAPGHDRDTQFFTTHDLAAANEDLRAPLELELSHFYDHSFSVHETSEISHPWVLSGESIQDSTSGLDDTASFNSSDNREGIGQCVEAIQGGLSDLKDVPNAGYLHSIVPQTMTVNLIVGIITICPPRRVMTRQWNREQDIVELVVADETKTGFSVTFWLDPERDGTGIGRNDDSNRLRRALADLRPRDIVLLRMVRLSSFRERVYGQSLRKGITRIDLLHRQQMDATDSVGDYSLRRIQAAREDDHTLMKVRRVREWIKRFVEEKDDRRGMPQCHPLPPDTQ